MTEEKRTSDITRMSLMVEIDGKVCLVPVQAQFRVQLLNFIAALSKDGVLPLLELGNDYKFEHVDMDLSPV